jgi:hypothetical protein
MSTSEKKSKTEFTEVALNKILAERFQKENSSFVLNETFHAHPIKSMVKYSICHSIIIYLH